MQAEQRRIRTRDGGVKGVSIVRIVYRFSIYAASPTPKRQAAYNNSSTGCPFLESVAVPIEYSEVRKGMVIVGEDKHLYTVIDRSLHTPGNLRSILMLKVKNLKTGSVIEKRFKPDDKVETAFLDKREMEYIYQDTDGYVFMDSENFEQVTLRADFVGDIMGYMKPNMKAFVVFYESNPISVELPPTVDLKVIETDPNMKGATAAAQYKPATLETGMKVQVPPFVGVGEMIRIDTRTGEYLERVKS
jgi:elongation factor P